MPRGRPKHDDILTPREWQVLDLLREGLTNEAVASRLSISVDTAKFHVSEIITKLGVSSRTEAARWPGEPRRRQALWPAWPWHLASAMAFVAALAVVAFLSVMGSSRGRSPVTGAPAANSGFPDVALEAPTPLAYATPGAVELTVCTDNNTWQRPSFDDQIAQMATVDPHGVRYGGFEGMHRSQFEARFWFPPGGGGDVVETVIEFSGLWTLPGIRSNWDAGCPVQAVTEPQDVAYAWLLGYETLKATYSGDNLIVSVRPKAAGFQVAMMRFPDARTYAGPVDFVDASGKTIGRTGVNFSFPDGSCRECRTIWSVEP